MSKSRPTNHVSFLKIIFSHTIDLFYRFKMYFQYIHRKLNCIENTFTWYKIANFECNEVIGTYFWKCIEENLLYRKMPNKQKVLNVWVDKCFFIFLREKRLYCAKLASRYLRQSEKEKYCDRFFLRMWTRIYFPLVGLPKLFLHKFFHCALKGRIDVHFQTWRNSLICFRLSFVKYYCIIK